MNLLSVNGFHYQGVIKTTYDQLVEIFGKPTFTDADPYEKVNAEWIINPRLLRKMKTQMIISTTIYYLQLENWLHSY